MRIEMKVDVGKLRDLVDNDVLLFANSEAARLMDPYVPMQSSSMKNDTVIDAEGIHYQVPYAHYQWYGEVMAGNPREYTGRDLHYTRSGAGDHWDELMMQTKYDVLLREIKNYIKENKNA